MKVVEEFEEIEEEVMVAEKEAVVEEETDDIKEEAMGAEKGGSC